MRSAGITDVVPSDSRREPSWNRPSRAGPGCSNCAISAPTESIATRLAPISATALRTRRISEERSNRPAMTTGSSKRGDALTKRHSPLASHSSMRTPSDRRLRRVCSGRSSKVTNTTGSPRRTPSARNCAANTVLPAPAVAGTSVMRVARRPPWVISSIPPMPDGTRGTSSSSSSRAISAPDVILIGIGRQGHDTFSLGEESLGELTHLIAVGGELDAGTTGRLTATLTGALEAGKKRVVIDLSETTFLDSTALADLLRDARWLGSPGSALAIVASVHAQPRGRFDMTGTRQVLSVCSTRDEAVEIVEHPPASPPPAPAPDVVRFRLYVDGASPNAAHAVGELEALGRRYLPGAAVDVIDIAERPDLAESERLLGAPTLVRISPPPVRRILGDLSDHEHVRHALGLWPAPAR